MFGRARPYNRSETLDRAEKARAKGRRKKAISEYKKVLEHDPQDAAVHQKIAPLLAQTGKRTESLKSFDAAAQSHLKQGFADRAISVYAQAAAFFPTEERLWTDLAKLQRERGKRADAVKVYFEAHRHFRSKADREKAIAMLRSALEIDPLHVDATIQLGKLLKKAGRRDEGLKALEWIAKQVFGDSQKKIRRAQFWLKPTPAAWWRWIRSGAAKTK